MNPKFDIRPKGASPEPAPGNEAPDEAPDRFIFDEGSPPVRRLVSKHGIPAERLREIAVEDARDPDIDG